MALRLKGEASFSHALDDGEEELVIAIDIATMIAVEQETGISLLAAHNGILSLVYCATVLRHGLAKGCKRIVTREEAAEMLLVDEGAHAAVISAFEGFLPKPKPKGEEEKPSAGGNEWDWDDLLIQWCEAGGRPDDFWHQTLRTVVSANIAYRRRRAWPVWHNAMLARLPGESLERLEFNDLTGEPSSQADKEAEAERQLRILRQWKAVDKHVVN